MPLHRAHARRDRALRDDSVLAARCAFAPRASWPPVGLRTRQAHASVITPRSDSVGWPDGETGPEGVERRSWQALRHYVGELLIGWNVHDAKISERDAFPHEVYVKLDVLGSPMMHRVLAHVDGGDVVAVRDRGAGNVDVEFAEELS